MYVAKESLYVDASKAKIVPENSREAAFLLVPKGGELPESEARRYGLIEEPKASAPAGDKGGQPAEDKGGKPAKPAPPPKKKGFLSRLAG